MMIVCHFYSIFFYKVHRCLDCNCPIFFRVICVLHQSLILNALPFRKRVIVTNIILLMNLFITFHGKWRKEACFRL